MKTIVLKGNENVGKTTSCRILVKTLIENGANIVYQPRKGEYIENVKVLEYKGKFIAVSSIGDSIFQIESCLNFMNDYLEKEMNNKIDFLFISSRDREDFISVIKNQLIRWGHISHLNQNYYEFLLKDIIFDDVDDYIESLIDYLKNILTKISFLPVKFLSVNDTINVIKFDYKKTKKHRWGNSIRI